MRVTENLLAANLLQHSRFALARVAMFQEQIASGRKIQRPSDDPSIAAKALSLRSTLRGVEAYRDNASSAVAFMSLTESSLSEVSDLLSRAKELMVASLNGTTDEGAAGANATELRAMIDSLLLVANRKVAGKALFGGLSTHGDAFLRGKHGVTYAGDTGEFLEELGPGLRVAVNLSGPQAFQTVASRLESSVDLDPVVSPITPLADLLGGTGIAGGHIRITDSAGASASLDLMGAENVGQIVNAINAAGIGVTASVTADGKAVELTDTAGGSSFQVEDILEGTLAADLGLATTSTTGTITGVDLDPAVSENTPIGYLLQGAGIGAGTWTIRNDSQGVARVATVDPSQANTIGDVLDLIEAATAADGTSLGLVARLDKTGIVIESTVRHTTLSVADNTGSTSAAALGIAGTGVSRDVFALLEAAALAVESRDTDRMDRMLREITTAVAQTAGMRGTYGARSRQVLSLAANLDDQKVDMTIRLADVEDVDFAQAAIELAKSETVYSATLAAGSRLFDLNLFNFIR